MRRLIHRLILKFLLLCQRASHRLEALLIAALRKLGFHVKRITPTYILAAGLTSLILFLTIYSISFLWPRTVNFSYSQNNCFTNPLVLPRLTSKRTSPSYKAAPIKSFSIKGYPIYSRTTCVIPTELPKENASEVISFGRSIFVKKIRIESGSFPTLASQKMFDKPIPTQDTLNVPLNVADRVFDYQLQANNKTTDCPKQNQTVTCDVAQLGLAQTTKYDFRLTRTFHKQPAGTIFERSLTTVESVHVTGSSVANDQTVYDTPSEFTISLNRPVKSMKGEKLYLVSGDKRDVVPATITLDKQTITVKPSQPLARSATFEFVVDQITAEDGGFLAATYSLPFKTSGGPKVSRVSIGTYKVSPASSITITFDVGVSAAQAWQNFVKLEVGGGAIAASVTARGNTITITPEAALPRCTPLTLKVLDGLQNNFGVSGGSAWQYKSRTICQSVFSIGTSVQGRAITAYSFGSGPSRMVFVGATHGDEKSSAYTLNGLIEDLEASGNIPAHRTVVIIPVANPDGFAMGQRTNANNVDLNRNFPTNNWKSSVVMPDKSTNPTGGGTTPLSEPESRAVANYVQGARLVLTYHAIAGTVIPNDAGDSVALAHLYDQKSNVYFASNSQTTSIFAYDTTGSLEDWLYDKVGTPALLVELWTRSGNEFAKHQSAMRTILGLQ
ncbi:MAG: DUF2817 domain-containing protein [Candidatus Saccharimonadales bacterium]